MNAKRLLKLADFLDALPRQKFDFGVIVRQDGKPMLEALKAGKTKCGTVACAIGWMPACFPRGLEWDSWNVVRLRSNWGVNFQAAEVWFGISERDVEHLFSPGARRDGASGLPDFATPKRVAKHIRKFVENRRATVTA